MKTKTAEEVLAKHYSGLAVSDITAAMHEFADQFRPKWVSVEPAHILKPGNYAFLFPDGEKNINTLYEEENSNVFYRSATHYCVIELPEPPKT